MPLPANGVPDPVAEERCRMLALLNLLTHAYSDRTVVKFESLESRPSVLVSQEA
jgi:hypothetical protein